MLNKILKLSGLLLVTFIFMANANARASNSSDSAQKIETSAANNSENPSAIKSFAQKIKQVIIAGNNKINAEISKFSNMVKQAMNKDKESDVSKQAAEPQKANLVNVPKKFMKNINSAQSTVQSIAGKLKAAISSGDYNLMASIIRTTPANLLWPAISSAVNDDPLVSVPLARSVHDTLSGKDSTPVINNMSAQLQRSNHQDVAEQVSQVDSGQLSSNNTSSPAGYEVAVNSSSLPTISGTMENPSQASPGYRP